MLDRAVHIGIIGCGAQAHVHFEALQALGKDIAIVAAVCDLNEERLGKAGEVWPEARRTTDYRAMLKPADLDLVIVATMPNTHEAMSLASLDAGAHVLCEKPFVMNVEQAENVLAKAADTGLQIQLGTNMRYMPSSQYLHDLVRDGKIGEPIFGKVWGCHVIPPVWAPHYHLATSGGGVLASTLVHALDLAMWVSGSPNPVTVSAATNRLFPGKRGAKVAPEIHAHYDVEDLIGGFVRFDNGTFFALEGNWCSESKDWHSFELTTTRGTLAGAPFSIKVDIAGEIVDQTPSLADDDWSKSIHIQDTALINKIRADNSLPEVTHSVSEIDESQSSIALTGSSGEAQDARQLLNLQKVIDACYESARSGREVWL